MAKTLKRELKEIPIKELKLHPENARKGKKKLIKKSIEKHGFFTAVVIQKSTKHILIGNNRVPVAKEMGIKSVPCIIVDVDDEEALEILAIDNKSSDEAGYDEEALFKLLDHIVSNRGDDNVDDALEGTGYGSSEYAALKLRAEWQDDEEVEKVNKGKGKSRKDEKVTSTEKRESLEERKKKIEEMGMRQTVLSIPVKAFKDFQEGLKAGRKELGVKTNEELFTALMIQEGYLSEDFVLIERQKDKSDKAKKDAKKK